MASENYITACGDLARSWLQMLASCIFGYQDIAGVTHYRINTVVTSDDCDEVYDFPDCDTSHIEPERHLVENLFYIDECSLLALKLYGNSSDANEYKECGEIPQSFLQMLARSIIVYNTVPKLNGVTETDKCTEVEALLDCSTNAIESERLLVQNAFGLDDCDRLALKLFLNTSSFEDYHTECTEQPESFIELLARCLVIYDGVVYLNILAVTGYCDDLIAFWTCNNGHIEPERALVENVFAVDDCGNLALKLFINLGEGREQ